MKLNTLKKWFRTLLALSISFVMFIGIFGGMKLEAKAANNIIIDVGDPNSMENFKSIIFNPDDTLTIHDSRGIISNGNCYSPDGYDGSIFNTITFDTKGYGSLYFTDLKGGIGNPQINNPQWQVSNIVYGYNTAHTIRIDFKLVDSSSSDSSDTSPSQPASALTPSTPSHECSFQWVTTVEPQPDADGLEEYKCTGCGAVQEQKSIPASVASVQNLCGFVYNAPQNGTVTTDFGRLHTISDYILKKMAERSDVTSIIQFEYQNQKLQIIFPAGTDYSPVLNDDDMMYGFYGIAPRLGLSVTER